jgi:ParB-like chromosome segregation protein Spo0J
MIRLETFFTTNLILDKPNFFNTLANTAFSPLQHMPFCGQKQYQNLNGRITPLAELSPVFWGTLLKTSSFFLLAIFATPVAIVARLASFYSPNVSHAFTSIRILKTQDDVARMSLIMKLPPALQMPILERLQQEREQQKKVEKLNEYLRPATQWLKELETVLKTGTDKEQVQQWLESAQQKTDYPHPFAFEERIKGILASLPPRQEFNRFNELMAFCSEKLRAFELTPEAPLQNQIQKLEESIKASFIENATFILSLKKQLNAMPEWLKDQRAKLDYPYPFHAVPLLLPIAEKLQIKGLEAFKRSYDACKNKLSEQPDLSLYLNEIPPLDHPKICAMKVAIARLKNLQEIQTRFDSLSSSLPLNNPPN